MNNFWPVIKLDNFWPLVLWTRVVKWTLTLPGTDSGGTNKDSQAITTNTGHELIEEWLFVVNVMRDFIVISVYIVEMELWRSCLIVHDMLLLIHRVILSNLGGQKRPILPENGIFCQLQALMSFKNVNRKIVPWWFHVMVLPTLSYNLLRECRSELCGKWAVASDTTMRTSLKDKQLQQK